MKAAFLYKFADYVEWPAAAFGTSGGPLTICVVGTDPFGSVLDDLTQGERAAGHAIQVRRLPSLEGAAACQVAYIAATRKDLPRLLAAAAGRPVLTVTDDGDAGTHGIINFVLRENRVRFDIDTELAAANGLAISSKLLSLAARIHGRADVKGVQP